MQSIRHFMRDATESISANHDHPQRCITSYLSGIAWEVFVTGHFSCLVADRSVLDPLTFDKRWAMLLSNVEGKMVQSTDLLQGTLDMLILKTLAPGQEHGWAIAQRIQQVSNDVLQIGQGSLYPALHRLEYRGWIRAEWGASENNRRARFYSLTAAGRKQLNAELENWDRLTGAVNLVLQRT
jgi:PadR family transcriptional regulator, regulatory protein PadR